VERRRKYCEEYLKCLQCVCLSVIWEIFKMSFENFPNVVQDIMHMSHVCLTAQHQMSTLKLLQNICWKFIKICL
jgi:hypothetical protein